MRLGDEPSDVEPEADSDPLAVLRNLDAAVLLEKDAQMGPGQADALILDGDAGARVASTHGEMHRRARRGETQRVVQQVLDRGPQALGIGLDPDRVGFGDELQPILVGLAGQRRHELAEIEAAAVEPEMSGLQLAHLEDVLGEAVEVAALAAEVEDRVTLGGAERGRVREIGKRRLDLAGRSAERMRDERQRFLAVHVDAAERRALAPYLIDEQPEHDEDCGSREAVPKHCRKRHAHAIGSLREDPRDRREQRDDHRRITAEPPAREADRDEVEDRESVLGAG